MRRWGKADQPHRWQILLPLSSILIFTLFFDMVAQRFDLSVPFGSIRVNTVTTAGSIIIILLSASLVCVASILALYVSLRQMRRIAAFGDELRYYVLSMCGWSALFVAYNTLGHRYGVSSFVYFTKGVFDENGGTEIQTLWKISPYAMSVAYYVPLVLVIVAAVSLAVGSSSLSKGIYPMNDLRRACRRIRAKRRLIMLSFQSAAFLVSTMIIMLFAWHNSIRSVIAVQVAKDDFTSFMFAFSSYWGLAYSLIIAGTFGPIFISFNHEISRTLEANNQEDSEKEIIERYSLKWIEPTEVSYVLTAIAPLLTGLGANSVSLFVPTIS